MNLVFCSLLVVLVGNINALNVGTTLYDLGDLKRKWTDDDALQLKFRFLADRLLPEIVPNGDAFLKYLQLLKDKFQTISNENTRRKIMLAMADAVGGYMQGKLFGQVKRAYYEGRVDYTTMNKLNQTLEQIKHALNTDGRGWLKPEPVVCDIPEIIDYTVGDEHNRHSSECDKLYIVDGEVPVPVFDDDTSPGAIVVPFNDAQVYSVDSSDDPQLLTRYFLLAMRCTAYPEGFLNDLGRWLENVVGPLLGQHRWYPCLAGVLRLSESVNAFFGKPEIVETLQTSDPNSGDDQSPAGRELFDFWSDDLRSASDDHEELRKTASRRHKRIAHHDLHERDGRPEPPLEPHFADDTLCDTGDLVPNSNVFLLAALCVLLFAWIVFGLMNVELLVRKVLELLGIY